MKLHSKTVMLFALALLISTFWTTTPLPSVSAEDVLLNQIVPGTGPVGTSVTVYGEIRTPNGSYGIFFDDLQVKTGNATLHSVTDTFIVPNSTAGGHPIKIYDVTNESYSESLNFTIQTQHFLQALTLPEPQQIQQGMNITIVARVTGGDEAISGNITVEDPADVKHESNVTLTIGQDGYSELNVSFPTDFSDAPHTYYVGVYDVSLNTAYEPLATTNFTIGLTNATEYHRFQTVHIQAANYTTTDVLKTILTYDGEIVFESIPRNASGPRGLFTANWTIPANASLGIYEVNITQTTPQGTQKTVADSHTFKLISKSFACEVLTENQHNEPVRGILVEANSTEFPSISYRSTTGEDGIALFRLEATNYTFTAVLNKTEVGSLGEISLSQNLTGPSALTISCSLAHLRIAVRDVDGHLLPFIAIKANFTHLSRQNRTILRLASTETNINGTTILRNLFLNLNYTVRAERYDNIFKTTTFNLTTTTWLNITCPKHQLIITVIDRTRTPIQDVQVQIYEWSTGLGGLAGIETTSATGEATFNLTFGKYLVTLYKNAPLNQTSVYVIQQPTNFSVYCKLYNLSLTINVVDYFGQRIPNANVTITREEITPSSTQTGASGEAKFTELIGGNYTISIYIADRLSRRTALSLQEPKSITLKLGEIVSIAGLITKTSYFITAISVILLIGIFLLALIYRMRKARQIQE